MIPADAFGALTLPVLMAAAYLLGSIPFGLLVTRLAGLGDIRRIGSGNIGATNVLRTGRKSLALATLLLDVGKGAVAIGLAAGDRIGFAGDEFSAPLAAWLGGAALIGHLFPIWLKFAGGKGVATSLGILAAIDWRLGLAAIAIWIAIAALFRYSSLSALGAALAAPLFAWGLGLAWPIILLCAFAAALVWWRHRANIGRLLAGTEPRIGRSR